MTDQTQADESMESLRTSKPRLDTNIRIYLQRYRDEEWYLLADPLAHNHVLVDQISYRLLQQLEQGTSVEVAIGNLSKERQLPNRMGLVYTRSTAYQKFYCYTQRYILARSV
jgi:hypothetical protein